MSQTENIHEISVGTVTAQEGCAAIINLCLKILIKRGRLCITIMLY